MSVIEKIRADQLTARKAKELQKVAMLSTLLGEITKVGKDNGNRETTEVEAISVIKKFEKNVLDTMVIVEKTNPSRVKEFLAEAYVYNSYLPQQLSEDELSKEISMFIVANDSGASMKAIMAHLKANFAGLYDGKTASTLANKLLAG